MTYSLDDAKKRLSELVQGVDQSKDKEAKLKVATDFLDLEEDEITKENIRRKYKALALKYPPDKNAGRRNEFQELNALKDFLLNSNNDTELMKNFNELKEFNNKLIQGKQNNSNSSKPLSTQNNFFDKNSEEAQEKARREAEAKAREAQEKARRKAEAKAREEAEAKARREAEAKARREAEAKAREAQEKARREAQEKAREAQEKARREAQEKARREAQEKARREAEARARREAQEKAIREAEAKARREAQEKARIEAEARARREAQEKAIREAEARAANWAQEQQYGARPASHDQTREKILRSKTPTDLKLFKKYYERFCKDSNQVMSDEESLKKSFLAFKQKQYQKYKYENGVLQKDGDEVDGVEFEKFLRSQECKVDDKDPLFLAMREYRLFSEFKSNYDLVVNTSNTIAYPQISISQLKQTFDSFRKGEYKVFHPQAKEFNKEIAERFFKGTASDNIEESNEYKRVSSDPVFNAYYAVDTRYFLRENDEARFQGNSPMPENTQPNQENPSPNSWDSIFSSLAKAKEYLLKLSKELEKIKLPDEQKSKFQELKDFFENFGKNANAPTSKAPAPQSKSGPNSWGAREANSFSSTRPPNQPQAKEDNGRKEPLRPSSAPANPKPNIAYFGPAAERLREKHKKMGIY